MSSTFRSTSCLLMGCWLTSQVAFATPAIVNLQIENDVYFRQDKHYTNGVTFSYLPLDTSYPKLSAYLHRLGLPLEADDLRVEYALTNTIYTPDNIEITEPQPHDHPWAGQTYFSASLSHKLLPLTDNWNYQQGMQLNAGILGPAAGARLIQSEFHKLINSRTPRGWHNQLRNEPTLSVDYLWQGQQALAVANNWYFIHQPAIGLSLGSPFTHLNYGWSIGLSNSPQAINLPAIGTASLANSYFDKTENLTWQLLVGAQQKLVAYNLFFDGQLTHSSPELDKKRWVNQVYLGASLAYKGWRLTSKVIHIGREFSGQEKTNTYATLGVSFYVQ